MTPKEKCDELCLKMERYSQHPIHPRNREQAKEIGKKLALVAVEEILPCTWKRTTYQKWGFIDVDEKTTTEYWEMVRGELLNL